MINKHCSIYIPAAKLTATVLNAAQLYAQNKNQQVRYLTFTGFTNPKHHGPQRPGAHHQGVQGVIIGTHHDDALVTEEELAVVHPKCSQKNYFRLLIINQCAKVGLQWLGLTFNFKSATINMHSFYL